MLHNIGDSAGRLWHYLRENPLSTMEDAAKSLKLKDDMVAMAVGWLAREDKLDFQLEGKTIRLTLKAAL